MVLEIRSRDNDCKASLALASVETCNAPPPAADCGSIGLVLSEP